jgi:tRNA A37 threonylcarbamoyladenosine dehydratase
MDNWLNRTEYLIGKENVEKLKNVHVAIFGLGGVGSYTIEALARSGIGHLTLVDKDVVDITNINRQLIANTTTIGKPKVDIAKERLLKINPNLEINTYQTFYGPTKVKEFFSISYDYIIDAIDTVSSKLSLVEEALKRHIPIISCMGTGNKLDPTQFEVSDITKTSVCPLAKVMRKELKERGISHLKVVYSKEVPKRFDKEYKQTPASISFVPSVAGLILASEVIKDLIK